MGKITLQQVGINYNGYTAYKDEKGKVYKVVAYSTPVEDEMFVVYL